MKKYILHIIIGCICTAITIHYLTVLNADYAAQKAAWNQMAAETFREALLKEVEWRSKIPHYQSFVGASGVRPLKSQIPDSVIIVTSKYGRRVYWLEKERFKRQLLEGGELNSGISYLIGEYPISVDTLHHRWDSLLNLPLKVATSIRFVMTDLAEQNDTTYAHREHFVFPKDSALVWYLGYRCEAEFVGCVHYPSLWGACSPLNWALLLLPFLLLAFILIYYPKISAAIRRRFIKKEIVHVADAPLERAKVYQLPDGMLFDVMAHSIRKGNEAFHLSPQSVNLLKLLLRSPERKVTIEGINQELWNGKASKGKIEVAISRFRSDIKKASPNLTLDYSNGTFQLKMPHSIEE